MKTNLQFKVVAFILIAITIVLASSVVAQDNNSEIVIQGCPRGQGYWANHPEDWTVTSLMMGIQFYSQAELLVFLPGGGGDASTMLAVQLATTKLNIAAGADAAQISATMLQADALLAQFGGKLPYNVPPSAPEGQALVSLAGLLDLYNNGQMSPNCAQTATPTNTPTATNTPTPGPSPTPTFTFTPGPSPTPTATNSGTTIIIEGPVQVININIITIYDINIQVDDHDPILTHIHIGDFVRVEGNAASSPILIVVAVTVFVVNVDVVVSNNNVVIWQDDGRNCGNAPPPWAPANGWRRRCENHTTTIIITGGSGDNGMGMGMGMGEDD